MAVNDIGPRIGIQGEKEFRSSIQAINAQMKALGAEMKAVTAEFSRNAQSEEALAARTDVLGRSIETAKNKMSLLDSQIQRQKERMAALATELERVIREEGESSAAASRAQNAYNRQAAEVARLEAQYQQTRIQLSELQDQMDQTDDQPDPSRADDVTAGLAAWNLLQQGIRGAVNAMQEAVSTGMAFDASISDIAATMGTTVDEIGDLRDFAMEMGATTAFTADQAAQALNYMALAGYDAETSMSMLPNVLNLAAAGGIELASASDMVTDAQSALGLSLEQTTQLVDEMALTSTKTNTSVGQLGEAILTVGGTAKFLAGGTQELNQVLGVLADNSIKGAEGGTKLRNIILSLSSPTKDAAAQLDALGVSVFDAEGNMRRFSEIFPDLQMALSSLTDQGQIEALSQIFNSRDIAAAQALLGTTADRWSTLETAISGAAGAAEQMAETRLDNLAGDLTLLQSAADGVRIAFSDSLTPALREAAQAGTGILTVVGNLISDFPFAGQAMAGLAAAGVTLGAGMVASSAGITSVTGAVGALTAALATNPFGQLAIAIGLTVTTLTAAVGAMEKSSSATQQLTADIVASKEAYQSTTSAIEEELADTQASIAILEELAAAENKTVAQKQTILQLVEELNQSIPELNLSYDEQTDSLNMTADAIQRLVEAEAERQLQAEAISRMTELYKEQKSIEEELARAQEALAAPGLTAIDYVMEYGITVAELQQHVNSLNSMLERNREEYDALAEEIEDTGDAAEQTGSALTDVQESVETLTAASEELEEASLYVAGAQETLTAALKEQKDAGSLSLDTTLKLIEAGYGAALAIDEETGAITLDRAAYIALAQAKIDDQLASLETQRQAIINAAKLEEEKVAAQNAGDAYWDMAGAKAAAEAPDTTALDAQIAALKRARDALGSYTGAAEKTVRRSRSASKAVKTQAQKDMEEYKAMKAELDHDKAMGLIEEEEYYNRLAALRDQYLTDAGNIDEYRKVTESIYKADQKVLQEREKLWETASKNVLKLEEDFQKELDSRAQQIVNSYKLFDQVPEYQITSGTELISNLEDQIAAIDSFYSNIAALEKEGVSSALVDDIRKMGVSASGELAGLLELTDEELTRYSELYEEKQALANRLASEELEDLRAQTNEEILGQMDDVAELYDTNGPALGMAFAQALAQGMFEGMPMVESMAQTVAGAAMSAFESTYNRDVESMMTASRGRVSTEDIGGLLAEAVNGMQTMAGAAQAGSQTIAGSVYLDSQEVGRILLPVQRALDKSNPEIKDDAR